MPRNATRPGNTRPTSMSCPHTIPRWLASLLQLATLAALTSICVAWSFVCLRSPNFQQPVAAWRIPADRTEVSYAAGARRSMHHLWPMAAKPEHAPLPPPATLIEDSYGWPAYLLHCRWLQRGPFEYDDVFFDTNLDLRGGVRLPPSFVGAYYGFSSSALALPLIPTVRGVVINLLFWGLPWLALLFIAAAIIHARAMRRWRAGLCTTCAYPRAPSRGSPCPECGLPARSPEFRLFPASNWPFVITAAALLLTAAALVAYAQPFLLSRALPPLHLAVRTEGYSAIDALSRAGESPEALWTPDPSRVRPLTPLMWAARRGDLEAMRRLIAGGAKLDTADYLGWTAAYYALMGPTGDAFNLLMDAGANPSVVAGGLTLMHAAAAFRQPAAIRRLADAGRPVAQLNSDGDTALLYAVNSGCADSVAVLLAAGADPNTITSRGGTILMQAARAGDQEIVKLLIAAGADVNATALGYCPVLFAAESSNPNALEVIRILLDAGADPDVRGENGESIEELLLSSPLPGKGYFPTMRPGTGAGLAPAAPAVREFLERYRLRR